MNGAAAQEFPG